MRVRRKLFALSLLLCLVLLLQGCGGGSGGNRNPRITGWEPEDRQFSVLPNAVVNFSIEAQDPDGDSLGYDWTETGGGTLTPNGSTATWKAAQEGSATVTVTVADGKGGTASHTWTVSVGATGNVIYVREDIESPTTWLTGNIYVIDASDIWVRSKLTIQDGVIVKFKYDSNLNTQGTGQIEAVGTAESPIIFTSILDDIGGVTSDVDDPPKPGVWGRVLLESETASRFEHCQFYYGGGEEETGMLDLGVSKNTKVKNCTFAFSLTVGLWVGSGTMPVVENNTFYSNQIPLVINVDTDLDDSNIFHNPDNPVQKNTQQGIFMYTDSQLGAYTRRDITWAETEVGIVLPGSVEVDGNTKLTLAPGTTVKLGTNMSLWVHGKLDARGQEDKRVVFTSYYDDEYGGDSAGPYSVEPQPGDWESVHIHSGASGVFDYCLFRFGGRAAARPDVYNSDTGALYDDYQSNGTLVENTIFEFNQRGLDMLSSHSEVVRSTFQNNRYPLWIAFDVDTDNSLTIKDNTYNAIYLGAESNLRKNEVKWQHTFNPYAIVETVYIHDATVLVGSGSVYRCWNGVEINIDLDGRLYRWGLPVLDSVIFTSYRDGAAGGDVGGGYGPAEGDWEGVYDHGVWLSHANIRYAKSH